MVLHSLIVLGHSLAPEGASMDRLCSTNGAAVQPLA
jgi:hypothetical protein